MNTWQGEAFLESRPRPDGVSVRCCVYPDAPWLYYAELRFAIADANRAAEQGLGQLNTIVAAHAARATKGT
jgi:hypothetical protein